MGRAPDFRVGLELGADLRLGQPSLGLPLRLGYSIWRRAFDPWCQLKSVLILLLHVILIRPASVSWARDRRWRWLWYLVGVGVWGRCGAEVGGAGEVRSGFGGCGGVDSKGAQEAG